MTKVDLKILITGFPYVRERYFATWRSAHNRDRFRFLLPSNWTAKKGKVVFKPPQDDRITTTKTLFHDSDTPVIGGLLKGWMPAFPIHLWRMRKKVELVYACSEPTLLTTLYFALFSKLLGKKFICFTWENISYEDKLRGLSKFVHLLLLRMNMALSDGLICGNPEGADIHRDYTNKPVEVIPMNGLNIDEFTHENIPKYVEAENLSGKIVFTYIGAIGFRKGIHLAVDALQKVREHIPKAHLVIVGSGEYDESLQRRIEQSAAKDAITRIQWTDNIKLILNASDVFLYPSIPHGGWAEQFGYSMAEASLMELPVISTHSGSIEHVVVDKRTGLLIEPNNTQALTQAMITLGSDASLRESLGRAGRQYIKEEFSHEVVAKKFTSFFDRI